MITLDSLLSSIYLEFDRNSEFRQHAATLISRLRTRGVTLPAADRECLEVPLDDGRLLGKAMLDDYLAKCTTPQWMIARRCAAGAG